MPCLFHESRPCSVFRETKSQHMWVLLRSLEVMMNFYISKNREQPIEISQ